MTASPEIRAELSRLRTTLPEEGSGPGEPIRPETAIAADAQRGIAECDTVIRDARTEIQAAQVRLERAIERRTQLRVAQHTVGVVYAD